MLLERRVPDDDDERHARPGDEAARLIIQTGASSASSATWGVQSRPAHVADRSGQRGRIRRATSPPASSPNPAAAKMSAHGPAPPSESRDTTAPSTMNGPSTSMCHTAYWRTMTHNHVRARNSDHPSCEVGHEPAADLGAVVLRRVHGKQGAGADDERAGIGRQRRAGPCERDHRTADGGAEHGPAGVGDPEQRVRLLQLRRAHGLGHEPGRGGVEEGRADAVGRDHRDVEAERARPPR